MVWKPDYALLRILCRSLISEQRKPRPSRIVAVSNCQPIFFMNINISKIKTADKLLFHTKGFSLISIAIREITQSYFNHVGQLVQEGGEWFVIEALFKGVQKTPLDKYIDNKSYDLKVIRLKPSSFKDQAEYEQGIRLSNFRMTNKIGKKYDFWAIAFIGIKYFFTGYYRKMRKYVPAKNLFQSRQAFFCSEAICESDYNISSLHPYLYKGKTNSDCSSSTPKDIGKTEHAFYVCGVDKK